MKAHPLFAIPLTLPLVALAAWAGGLERAILGKATIVDLTTPLNEQTPYPPGSEPFRVERPTDADRAPRIRGLHLPEEAGTTLNAPARSVPGGATVEKIPPRQLVGPAVVVDVRSQVAAWADYQVTVEDLTQWERRNGRIPKGAIVLLFTDWDRRWGLIHRPRKDDDRQVVRPPGFSREAADFLVRREINGIGLDALGPDHVPGSDPRARQPLLEAGKYELVNLRNLGLLPPKGAKVIVAPIPVEGGVAAPARIFAILP